MPADPAPPPRRFRLEDLLAEGRDPPSTILAAASALADDESLTLDAPFDPVPLRQLLAGHGLEPSSQPLPDGRWRLTVRRGTESSATPPPETGEDSRSTFWLEDGVLNLDVRDLPPPRPMMEILRVIDAGLAGTEMVAHVPHAPVHLFPELEDRGWTWRILGQDDDGVRVQLVREDGP